MGKKPLQNVNLTEKIDVAKVFLQSFLSHGKKTFADLEIFEPYKNTIASRPKVVQ